MAKRSPKRAETRSRPERVSIAREISEARAANPGMTIAKVIQSLGYTDVSEKSYWNWCRDLKRAYENGETIPTNGEQPAEHFPLALIPAKPVAKPKKARINIAPDEDKALAARLLEVAAALLRR